MKENNERPVEEKKEEKEEKKDVLKEVVSDIIFEAAISKAIEDKRIFLIPSMQHFIQGGNVNGEFGLALKKLMRWVENKTIESCASRPSMKEALEKIKEAAKELLHLHSCEQEGLQSGKPSPEQWYNAVNKLSDLIYMT